MWTFSYIPVNSTICFQSSKYPYPKDTCCLAEAPKISFSIFSKTEICFLSIVSTNRTSLILDRPAAVISSKDHFSPIVFTHLTSHPIRKNNVETRLVTLESERLRGTSIPECSHFVFKDFQDIQHIFCIQC